MHIRVVWNPSNNSVKKYILECYRKCRCEYVNNPKIGNEFICKKLNTKVKIECISRRIKTREITQVKVILVG